ncbi:hypothetical protein KUTeg_002458 [Tegillarca granosa]|uniref:Cation efflux protein transmembrane domain-containing protein n=1 Tax=Tegillarca granosa TaxID=220873 RepID=A0ABQ9FUE7_TEGGR|nr:hypothetical protein KUTeg_002458 [Tegillarca granosa]
MCRKVESPTVKALAQDHRNDVLSNTLAIICGYIGSQEVRDRYKFEYLVHVDPIGAILISLYIAITWYITGKENTKAIAGKSAKPDTINKLAWMILNHHEDISHINACIELPADTTLSKSTDISTSLEKKLENIVEIDHAVIHTQQRRQKLKT